MGVIETGMLEQVYATIESSYNTAITVPASTDAVRALEAEEMAQTNRKPSGEKRGTPDEFQNLPNRTTASWNIPMGMWEPSGTIGTPSYWGPLIKGCMGAQHTIAGGLVTTVAVSPAATASGCTLTSVTGLQVGDLIVFTVGGLREVTRVLTIVSSAITYDTLSAAPDTPGAAVAGVTYSMASLLTGESFTITKFYNAAAHQEYVSGAIVDKMIAQFDGTKPVMIQFSGAAAFHGRSGITKPGAFTTAGSPINGATGQLMLGTTAFLIHNLEATITNQLGLRNTEIGTTVASDFFRSNFRKIALKLQFYFDGTTPLTHADAFTHDELRLVLGSTNGKMLACVMPNVEWEIGNIPKDLGPKIITAQAVGFAGGGNDSIYFAEC
jgi:hypothetical protein